MPESIQTDAFIVGAAACPSPTTSSLVLGEKGAACPSPSPSSMLIIGVGNEFRGDDAAGLAVIRLLKAKHFAHVTFMEADSGCDMLLESWATAEKVIIIDAVSSRAKPGTIYRFDALAQPIPESCAFYSTHAFGIAQNLELARVLDQLPPSMTIYGIAGEHFTTGAALSLSVQHAVHEVVALIMLDIQESSEL